MPILHYRAHRCSSGSPRPLPLHVHCHVRLHVARFTMEDSGPSTHAPTALLLGRVSSLLLCKLATLLFLLLLPHGNYRLFDNTDFQSHTCLRQRPSRQASATPAPPGALAYLSALHFLVRQCAEACGLSEYRKHIYPGRELVSLRIARKGTCARENEYAKWCLIVCTRTSAFACRNKNVRNNNGECRQQALAERPCQGTRG
jgi:hypothetical protein